MVRTTAKRFTGLLRDNFYSGTDSFTVTEIPSEGEVRTAEQLHVEIPADNLDFHTIALKLSREAPRNSRETLAEVVRAKTYNVTATEVSSAVTDGLTIKHWRLKMDDDWTVPAVDILARSRLSTVIVIGDEGRAALAPQVQRLISEGKRVVAVDPFYFGESKIAKRDYLFALLVSSIGDRPIWHTSQSDQRNRTMAQDGRFD